MISGSAQQFARVCILRGLLESDEFGLSGSQAFAPSAADSSCLDNAATAEQSFDVAVGGFHHPHRYLRPAIVQKYPRDDPATCGLVSPSVSAAASANGRSTPVDNGAWPSIRHLSERERS